MTVETKNDKAWHELFTKYNILNEIDTYGSFLIKSSTINSVREARLMTKFDHYNNLPSLFRDNDLSILPVSRSEYIIGRMDVFSKITYDNSIEEIAIASPSLIESIQYNDLYSESSAIHYAHLSKMIDDFVGEETYFTVSGRMSTDRFDFSVKNTNKDKSYEIKVNNSQCEIDGGFESKNYFLIIEAKNYHVEDFLVRQLYYPYRLWCNRIRKQIIPVFMTFSNDVFSFFIYQFKTLSDYNSLTLVSQKNYRIAPEQIELTDIYDVFIQTKVIQEPEVPFPQANKFERVIDLLGLLFNRELSKEYITQNYQFDIRQTDYYTNAAIYLGLVCKNKNSNDGEITYYLSDLGRKTMSKDYRNKYLSLVKCILQHEVFNKAFAKYFNLGYAPDKDFVGEIMRNSYIYNVSPNSHTTIERRSQTVMGWIAWIVSLQN